jgi:ribosomal protein L29
MQGETIEQLEAAVKETLEQLAEAQAKKLHEYVDVLNHDLRRYRRAIRQLKAGA